MVMIQQTMDLFPNKKNSPIIAIPKMAVSSRPARETAAAKTVPAAGNINVSAFCTYLARKGIRMGRNQMFKWLRENGYISKQKSTWNMPLPKYVGRNLFDVKETFVFVSDEQVPRYSPLITPEGMNYLCEKLKSADGPELKRHKLN
jgi:phage antirepressor YoqD-like protein